MKLNHTNLNTSDAPALVDFFIRFFGFELLGERAGPFIWILRGEDGFILTVMALKPGQPANYPENFHVGFFVGKEEMVRAKHAELTAAGFKPQEVERLKRGGQEVVTFYCRAPGGILVEVADWS